MSDVTSTVVMIWLGTPENEDWVPVDASRRPLSPKPTRVTKRPTTKAPAAGTHITAATVS